jgi:hypothetical protein
MARIKYVGTLAVTSWQGVTFWQGCWTSDAGLGSDDVATLAANPTFQVDMANDGPLDTPPSPPPAPPPTPVVPTGVEPNGDADDADGDSGDPDVQTADAETTDEDSGPAAPAPSLSI